MKKYNQEFKLQAIKLAEDLGSAPEAARQLGISDANIYSWRKRYSGQSISASKIIEVKPEDLAKQNQRLQQENIQLKKVNHILKAAAAFFSQDHLK
jgi:transposase